MTSAIGRGARPDISDLAELLPPSATTGPTSASAVFIRFPIQSAGPQALQNSRPGPTRSLPGRSRHSSGPTARLRPRASPAEIEAPDLRIVQQPLSRPLEAVLAPGDHIP